MLNRPETTWLNEGANRPNSWDSDRAPGLRLPVLWVGMLISLLLVAARMGQLQMSLRDKYASGFDQRNVVVESIPPRVGRILAADGSVLAGDEEQYDLQVHYRLIQEPADEHWLRREAWRSLSRVERKHKIQVAGEMQRVLQRRRELWTAVSQLSGRSPQDLDAARSAIQQRIENIRAAVKRHRAERLAESTVPMSVTSTTGWQAIWNLIQRELTEPPIRHVEMGPIREEEEHHTVLRDVNADVKAEIEAHPERYPHVRIFVRTRRIYPQGELASHLIGSRTPMTAEEFSRERRATPLAALPANCEGDPVGRSGLELKYESHLHGQRGQRRLIKNRRQEVIEEEVVQAPQHGRDLVLTVDKELQKYAEQLLDEAMVSNVLVPNVVDDETNHGSVAQPTCPQGGCLVAVDIHSGAIIAAASFPRFDLNLYVNPDQERWNDLLEDRRKPFFNRVTQMKLPPGSVFKIVSAVAAVESGTVDPNLPIHCRGYLDRPSEYRCLTYRHHGLGHGDMRLADALCRSCNVYFFTAARRMGPAMLVDWAERFGIGQATGIDLPSESAGNLPSPRDVVAGQPRRWRTGDTMGLVIGQADLLVTPLQMVRAVAAIGNGGFLVTPHLAGDVGPVSIGSVPSFRPVFAHPEPKPIEGLHRETLLAIREGLDMVVNHDRGTAFKHAKLKSIRLAGKTGTAETNSGVDHAWFAGYVPADRPRVAFVVVLEHGGSGGQTAGPVAKKFVECLLEMGLVTPTTDLARE